MRCTIGRFFTFWSKGHSGFLARGTALFRPQKDAGRHHSRAFGASSNGQMDNPNGQVYFWSVHLEGGPLSIWEVVVFLVGGPSAKCSTKSELPRVRSSTRFFRTFGHLEIHLTREKRVH